MRRRLLLYFLGNRIPILCILLLFYCFTLVTPDIGILPTIPDNYISISLGKPTGSIASATPIKTVRNEKKKFF